MPLYLFNYLQLLMLNLIFIILFQALLRCVFYSLGYICTIRDQFERISLLWTKKNQSHPPSSPAD